MNSLRDATWRVDILSTRTAQGNRYYWTAYADVNVGCEQLTQNAYSKSMKDAWEEWEAFADKNGIEFFHLDDERFQEKQLDQYLEATAR